jgi:2-polyprenyl-3-methyl-5-hydroxy-6-metoxy-1,4-benzoquinol methylase
MKRVHYTTCPVCSSLAINPLLTVKDHSVSREDFVVWQCSHCSLRFTQDVPDEEIIAPYYQSPDYISHSNTRTGLLNQLYQKVRKYTLQQKASLIIEYTTEKGSLLDIGAGIGAFLNVMQHRGWRVTGIEPDEGARGQANKLFDITLQEASVLQHLPPTAYDAITLWHVLEHVHSLHEYVEHLKNLLKPGGRIFIAVPNYTSLDADNYSSHWAAYDVPRHLYHFTPKAMDVLMKEHSLKILAQKPMWFDAFYISLLSSKYKNGKTSWLSAVITGLRSNIKALFHKKACSSLIYIIAKD